MHIRTSFYDFLEIMIFYTSFTDEVDESDHFAAEWRRHHARSTAPAHKSEGGSSIGMQTVLTASAHPGLIFFRNKGRAHSRSSNRENLLASQALQAAGLQAPGLGALVFYQVLPDRRQIKEIIPPSLVP